MKSRKSDIYNLNQPLSPVFDKKFNLLKMRKQKVIKGVNINERIVEIPFVLENLHMAGEGRLNILELGCMESILPIMLASTGHKVCGIDIRNYPYTHPELDFLRGDICRLPFRDRVFDAVIAVSVIEHLGLGAYGDSVYQSGDLAAIEKIYDCLKVNGLFFLTIPFGVSSLNKKQRVYNSDSIIKLLGKRFTIKKSIFSVMDKSYKGNPVWEITSLEKAEKIASPDKTNAVALYIVQKA